MTGTKLTHPGVYCLRTNELNWDAVILWRTYTQLTDLEAVFRSLKSKLGLRPVTNLAEPKLQALYDALSLSASPMDAGQSFSFFLLSRPLHMYWGRVRVQGWFPRWREGTINNLF